MVLKAVVGALRWVVKPQVRGPEKSYTNQMNFGKDYQQLV